MFQKYIAKLIGFVFGLLLCSCDSLSNILSTQSESSAVPSRVYSCPPLPDSFTDGDIVGTWVARYSLQDTDTITINQDSTYKQIYSNPDANTYYESELYRWWLEHRPSGYVRIHLEGMRRAGEVDSMFLRDGGGVDPDLYTAIDMCEDDIIEMPHEIILIVTGADHYTPRGIVLRHARIAGSEWYWSFELLGSLPLESR